MKKNIFLIAILFTAFAQILSAQGNQERNQEVRSVKEEQEEEIQIDFHELGNLWGDFIEEKWTHQNLDKVRLITDMLADDRFRAGTDSLAKIMEEYPEAFFRKLKGLRDEISDENLQDKNSAYIDSTLKVKYSSFNSIWEKFRRKINAQYEIEGEPDYYDEHDNLVEALRELLQNEEVESVEEEKEKEQETQEVNSGEEDDEKGNAKEQENQNDFRALRSTDFLHPKMFVRVHEVRKVEKKKVDVIPIYIPVLEGHPDYYYYPKIHNVDAEIDLNGNIEITFDRKAINKFSNPFWQAAIIIRGTVKGELGARRIEIPGYTLVGRQADTSFVKIDLGGALGNLWGDFIEEKWTGQNLGEVRLITVILAGDSLSDGTDHLARIMEEHPTAFFRKLEQLQKDISADSLQDKGLAYIDSTLAANYSSFNSIWKKFRRKIKAQYEIVGDSLYYDKHHNLVEELRELLEERELSGLKDTAIPISLTGAKIGDQIVINIISFETDAQKRRELILRLNVTRFGLINRVSDSFLFINRINVNDSAVAVDDAMAAPQDTNFQPSPGVTFGWTWFHRKNKIIRFLKPGFGINVSFPRFTQMRTVQLATETVVQPDSTTITTTRLSSSEVGNDVDVGFGPVLSLFNNAIQFTYGWNLTVQEKRAYWGVGFSFVKVIKAAARE